MKPGDSFYCRPHPASFRDPASRVHELNGRIIRSLTAEAVDELHCLQESGLLDELTASGWLIESKSVDSSLLPLGGQVELIEHPRLPFVSYPYEWPFRLLQRAAVFHLDLHLDLLSRGFTLTDATAYNVQFRGLRPVFIDISSLRRYREGELWLGHRQFCEQFLNPLLLDAFCGIPYHCWYRGALEGIPTGYLCRLLPWTRKINLRVVSHVVLQDWLQRSAASRQTGELRAAGRRELSRRGFTAILEQLRNWIADLRPGGSSASPWQDYEHTRTYLGEDCAQKSARVAAFVESARPALLWDLGCNTGEYSLLALRAGAGTVVGFDADVAALDRAFRRADAQQAEFQPLYLDAANPSPDQGWRQRERAGFQSRVCADAVLALAFEHHLTIARNIPLPDFLDWLTGLASRGLVEFVEKSEETVQRMLALRADIFADYTLPNFENLLADRARIVRKDRIGASGRWLFEYLRQP